MREVASELKRPVAILGDLQGPRIRIGDLAAPIQLENGAEVVLAPEDPAIAGVGRKAGEIPVTYERLADDLHVGDRVLIDDGLLELVVVDVRKPRVVARVLHGGPLRSHKGMNFPGVLVSAPSLTDKDRADVVFAVEQELDYLALSFVRRAERRGRAAQAAAQGAAHRRQDREGLGAREDREHRARCRTRSWWRAAISASSCRSRRCRWRRSASLPLANQVGRPVITATQMLESMVTNPRPTRAEASDVANAILDGTDAVMLSAETAAGKYPRLAVEAMTRIISEIEKHPPQRRDERSLRSTAVSTEFAIAAASGAAVRMLGAPALIVFTKSGFSARVVASQRPYVPILVLTDIARTYRQLALIWGVIPELVPHANSYDEMVQMALEAVKRRKLATPGDKIVVTAGVPFDVPGSTNTLKVETV